MNETICWIGLGKLGLPMTSATIRPLRTRPPRDMSAHHPATPALRAR
jgi:hypothetical protein